MKFGVRMCNQDKKSGQRPHVEKSRCPSKNKVTYVTNHIIARRARLAIAHLAALLGFLLVFAAGGMVDKGTATLGQIVRIGALGLIAFLLGAIAIRWEESNA
jgi:hypothetical protein